MTLFGNISRHESLAKIILQGYDEGLPKRNWMDDILDWSYLPLCELLYTTADCEEWRKLCSLLSCSPPMMTSSLD